MVHLGFLFFLGGAVGAVWRGHRSKVVNHSVALPVPQSSGLVEENNSRSFDDVGELRHYQRVSWYALAFTSSGWLFYPPAALLAAPLMGYNAYNFLRTLGQSNASQRKSALTIFELIGISATLSTGKPMAASVVMLFAFIRRNMLLQAGNISNNLSPETALRFQNHHYWVLRDGVEIEVLGSQLQNSDVVVFSSGDVITIEGVVVYGEGEVRQFGLNKKMKMLHKAVGDKVYPFTHLQAGKLQIKQKIK